jgi:hypothetical protein
LEVPAAVMKGLMNGLKWQETSNVEVGIVKGIFNKYLFDGQS